MVIQKQKITAATGSFLFGVFLVAAYFITHRVPLSDIYLGKQRLTHAGIVFVFFLIAGLFFYLSRKKTKATILFYLIAIICAVGIPLLLFITYANSFRGAEWAIETVLIGWIPVLFLFLGCLTLMGKRIFALLTAICCFLFALYHLVLFFRNVPRLGRAFSSVGMNDIVIILIIALFSFLCALANLKYFLASRR